MTSADALSQPTEAERFQRILRAQRATCLGDGAPSSAARRSDLTRFRAALIARRGVIEEAIDTGFGHRSRQDRATTDVERVTGKRPLTVEEFVAVRKGFHLG
ncbi:hypothetical protein [Streptomyces sp. MB09-02B]|uniref:hypothetical protein n=1 Tax=Streptomyces sp. MB09-02B TaxID=3028667 RepID=UPI0029BE1363|nr:hypothetical protein [Streptomyces sp. MB09-02B]MDX3638463.1 hypothetical protein [Streptomyces sp. MB09-02B]